MEDKEIECSRYDRKAKHTLRVLSSHPTAFASYTPAYLLSPYLAYYNYLHLMLSNKIKVLEVGAGTGTHSGILLASGADVCLSDISTHSLAVVQHIWRDYPNLTTEIADLEKLPFCREQFDLVVSAGALSYGDNRSVMAEIYRVLKDGGKFICVDSLNHNPIYRFNRFIHYLRGNRSKSTLLRMPTLQLLEQYNQYFGNIELKFFGSLTWLMPLIAKFTNEDFAKKISDWFDQIFSAKRSSFKFVMLAHKIKKY